MNVKEKIKHFIVTDLLFTGDIELPGDDDSLLERGIFDSTSFLRFMYFLEEEFGIQILMEEITMENFNTLNGLEHYIRSKMTQHPVIYQGVKFDT